jgi:thioredoxin
MATVKLDRETFAEFVATGVVLIDWWGPACPPCRTFAPIFEAASERHPNVRFGKVNCDEAQELAAAFEVRSIPSVMVFRDGALVAVRPGLQRAAALDGLIADAARAAGAGVRVDVPG